MVRGGSGYEPAIPAYSMIDPGAPGGAVDHASRRVRRRGGATDILRRTTAQYWRKCYVVSGRTPPFPYSVPHSVDYTPLTQPFFPTVTSQCSPSYLKPLGRLHSGHSSRTNLTGSPLSRNRISIRRRVPQCSHRRWRRSQYNSSYIESFSGRADMGSPPLRFAYTVWCVGGLISPSPPASHPQLHASADGHFL